MSDYLGSRGVPTLEGTNRLSRHRVSVAPRPSAGMEPLDELYAAVVREGIARAHRTRAASRPALSESMARLIVEAREREQHDLRIRQLVSGVLDAQWVVESRWAYNRQRREWQIQRRKVLK